MTEAQKLAQDTKEWEQNLREFINTIETRLPSEPHRTALARRMDHNIREMMAFFSSQEYEQGLGDFFTNEVKQVRDEHLVFLAEMRKVLATKGAFGDN